MSHHQQHDKAVGGEDDEEKGEVSDGAVRARLFRRFRACGAEHSLKAQLRVALLRIIHGGGGVGTVSKSLRVRRGGGGGSVLAWRVADAFVADHLARGGCAMALSVFAAECGLGGGASTGAAITTQDAIDLMKVDERSRLYRELFAAAKATTRDDDDDRATSVLVTLVAVAQTLTPQKADASAQTTQPTRPPIEELLRTVDAASPSSTASMASTTME
jgi:hypothetical protein